MAFRRNPQRKGAGVKDRNIADNAYISPYKLDHKSVHEDFSIYGASATGTALGMSNMEDDGTVYVVTANRLNLLQTGTGNVFGFNALVQQDLPPILAAGGLNIGCDQTDNDGVELWTNDQHCSGLPFSVAHDPGFYFRCRFKIATASGTDFLQVGFRSVEAPQADYEDYQHLAALGWNNDTGGAWDTMSIKSNAATTVTATTDTALADDTWVVVTVLIDSNGVISYQLNDKALTVAPAPVTLAQYSIVKPFFRFLQANAAQTGAVTISHWDVGWGQPDRRLV